jgi:hypothetical protein
MRASADLLDLLRRAHGSRFLLVELLRGLREEGLLRFDAGRAAPVENRLPARVRDSMRERLARMPDKACQLPPSRRCWAAPSPSTSWPR